LCRVAEVVGQECVLRAGWCEMREKIVQN
jgi:hypothetical protein